MKERAGKPEFICDICGKHSTSRQVIASCEVIHTKITADAELWNKQPQISVAWSDAGSSGTCDITFAESIALLIFPGYEMFVDSKEEKSFRREFIAMVPLCGKRPTEVLASLSKGDFLTRIKGWTETWDGDPEETWNGVRVPTEIHTTPARYRITTKGNSVYNILLRSSNPAQMAFSAYKALRARARLERRRTKAIRALEAAENALRELTKSS